MPTAEDANRLRAVAKRHSAKQSLLGIWKKGKAVRFFVLQPRHPFRDDDWTEVINLDEIFR